MITQIFSYSFYSKLKFGFHQKKLSGARHIFFCNSGSETGEKKHDPDPVGSASLGLWEGRGAAYM